MKPARTVFLIALSVVLIRCTLVPHTKTPAVTESFPVTPAAEVVVSGTVSDRYGRPLPYAIVRVQASAVFTHTNTEGDFLLEDTPITRPFTLTAFSTGYYIQAARVEPEQSTVDFKLEAHPTEDNSTYAWLSSEECAECHAAGLVSAATVTLPFDEWQQDAHAQTAINPRFLSMYNGTDVIGRQSPPTAYVTQRDYGRLPLRPNSNQPYYGPGYKLDFPESAGNCAACHLPAAAVDNPYSTNPNTVTGVEAEGIPCDLCHKVWGVNIDSTTGLPYPNMPGVLSFEFRRPARDHQLFIGPFDDVAPGEDSFSPLQNQSEFCAPCHYGVFWETPIYNSFGEWLTTPYADPASDQFQTCQDCHMPPLGVDHFARHEVGGLLRDPERIFSHRMPGAADETLLQNTATLQLTAERQGDFIQVAAVVTNTDAGHHIPTDSPLRQIFLVVKATDTRGHLLELRNGPLLPDWAGNLAGQPGVYFAKILEQLWTRIAPTGAYWTPTRLVEDTRLPALAVNRSEYLFTARDRGQIRVEAHLIFRRAYYDLIQQKGWDTPDILMERVTAVVP